MNLNQHNWGEYRSGHGCDYFLPSTIHYPWAWDHSGLDTLLEQAALKLGELNGLAALLPDIKTITTFHHITEALSSCRLDGQTITLNQSLQPAATLSPEYRPSRQLVDNYIHTLIEASKALRNQPLTQDSIQNIHPTLYSNISEKELSGAPLDGAFRLTLSSPVSNRRPDSAPGDTYIPPDPIHISPLMHDLERFILNRENHPVPELIRASMVYYQLLTIQPFPIGNGKTTRMITLLFMIQNRLLTRPVLNLSRYFENNHVLHDKLIHSVRNEHDMISWIKFFLMGVQLTAADSIQRLSDVHDQKKDLSHWIETEWGRRSGSGLILLQTIYAQPMIDVKGVQKACRLTPKAAGDLVRSFIDAGILTEITGQARNRIFLFEPYLNKFTS